MAIPEPLLSIPELPTKVSELARLAVADMQKAKADGCAFGLAHAHWKDPGKPLCVCPAGAVMRRGVTDDKSAGFCWFDSRTQNLLFVIFHLAFGSFNAAFLTCYRALNRVSEVNQFATCWGELTLLGRNSNRQFPADPEKNFDQHCADMLQIAEVCERYGQ